MRRTPLLQRLCTVTQPEARHAHAREWIRNQVLRRRALALHQLHLLPDELATMGIVVTVALGLELGHNLVDNHALPREPVVLGLAQLRVLGRLVVLQPRRVFRRQLLHGLVQHVFVGQLLHHAEEHLRQIAFRSTAAPALGVERPQHFGQHVFFRLCCRGFLRRIRRRR